MRIALVLIVVAACGNRDASPSISDALHRPIAEMKLTEHQWGKLVVEPYREAYDDYARAFDAAAPAIAAQIQNAKTIVGRSHYAGDPKLTRGQARARWALPVQFPAQVATLDGAELDAVFVSVGDSYKAIVGVDHIVVDRTRALDATCAPLLEELGAKACQEVGWEIADAALRGDKARLAHACSLARTQCAR